LNRVHDLKTLRQVCLIEAHDAEVLYLDYTKYNDKIKLFASASRDRLIHVFNVNKVSNCKCLVSFIKTNFINKTNVCFFLRDMILHKH